MFAIYKSKDGQGEKDLRAALKKFETKTNRAELSEVKLSWDGTLYWLEWKGDKAPISYEGFDYLMYRLNMPVWYMTRCTPDMVLPHVEHWIKQAARPVDVLTVNQVVMAVVTLKFAQVPNEKIVDGLANVPGLKTTDWSISPKQLVVHATGETRSDETIREIRTGDEVAVGLRVTNSETGWGQLTCSGILYRAAKPQSWATLPPELGSFAKRHQGDPDKLWVSFNETWTTLTTGFGQVAARLEKMAKTPVTPVEVEGIVEAIVVQLHLPAKVKELLTVGAMTIYDVWEKLIDLSSNPDYAGHAEDIRKAAGEWIVVPGTKNPLWVTL